MTRENATADAAHPLRGRFSVVDRGIRELLLPGLVLGLGVWWLASLLASVPDDVFFSGDGGLKALMSRQILDGRWAPWLELEQPAWIHELWEAGMYPFRPPFAYQLSGRWYSSFEWTFPALSTPAYALVGHRGLYLLPALSVVAVWLRFAWLLRALRVHPVPTAAALALLIFATPLTFYAGTIWEHAPAVAIAFAGYADLVLLEHDPRRPRAARAGLLLGAACWLRPEAMVFAVGALVVHSVSRHGWRVAQAGVAFGTVTGAYLAFNRVVYGEWIGIHAIQVIERERTASMWLAESVGHATSLAEIWLERMTFTWLALLLAGATLTARGPHGSASRRTLLLVVVAFVGTAAIVPNSGGLQIGPRYLLLLVPLVALLVALGLEQLRPATGATRWTLTAIAVLLAAHVGLENVTAESERIGQSYSVRILPSVRAIKLHPRAGVLFGHHWAAMEMSEVITEARPVVTVDDVLELNTAVETMLRHDLDEVMLVDGPGVRRFSVRGLQRHGSVWVNWTVASDRGEYHVILGMRSHGPSL